MEGKNTIHHCIGSLHFYIEPVHTYIHTYQVVHRVFRLGLADLDETLSDSREDVPHEVVAKWETLCLQHLALLGLYQLQLGLLEK